MYVYLECSLGTCDGNINKCEFWRVVQSKGISNAGQNNFETMK